VYASPDIIKVIKCEDEIGGACSTHGSDKKCS